MLKSQTIKPYNMINDDNSYSIADGLGFVIERAGRDKQEERFKVLTEKLLNNQCYILRYILNEIKIGNSPKHEITNRFILLLQDKISQNKDFEIYGCAPSRIEEIYTIEQLWENLGKGLSLILQAQNQEEQKARFRSIKIQILACPFSVLQNLEQSLSQKESVGENPIIFDMKRVLKQEVKSALDKPFYRDDYLAENIVSDDIKSFREATIYPYHKVQNANPGLNI